MNENLKSAVILSILSAPSKLGLWDTVFLSPGRILNCLNSDDLAVQDIIQQYYKGSAVKAADLIIEKCIRKGIKIITIWDEDYPKLLKEIHNPPLVLYLKGELTVNRMISIVGTRNSDEKSALITRKISERAALTGYTIVSGMALGIDRNAHIGAINAGGSTIAVLPGGVDIIYPYKNADLYEMISESKLSAIISEYPPGVGTGQKWTFAKRNRIISGMSEAVIIIQAPKKSGAMITARYAVEQNRDLFVCPGNAFDDMYGGCHELIKQGAAIFTDLDDLFEGSASDDEILLKHVNNKKAGKNLIACESGNNIKSYDTFPDRLSGKVELQIFKDIKNGSVDVDELIRNNNFTADEVNQCITLLEIEGIIEKRGNKLYKKINNGK